MTQPTLKPTRKTGRWLVLLGVVALAGFLAWPLIQRARTVRQAIPARPELGSFPPALVDEITTTEAAARSWKSPATGLGRLAGLYQANGFFSEAQNCYRVLAALEPQEPRWPHLIANIEASFGRIGDALPWQQRAAELAPDNFIPRLRLADLQFKYNQLASAEKNYARALQLAPANPYVLLGLARCALQREDWTTARTHLRQAVEAQPKFVGGWALLANVESHLSDQAAAAVARQRGNGQFRELVDPWLSSLNDLCYDPYQLSVAAAVATDPAHARQLVERAIAIAPDVASYHRQLAKLLITSRDLPVARIQFEKAVALAPDDAEAWSGLVELLIDTHDGRAAVSALIEGLRHCPQSGFLHFTNGRRLAALSQPAEAEAEFKLSKRLQPSEIRAYVELSSLYVQAGRLPEAIAEARGALAVDPADLTVMGMLAQLSIMQGNEAEAIQWAKKIRASPTDESPTLNRIQRMFFEQFSRPLPL